MIIILYYMIIEIWQPSTTSITPDIPRERYSKFYKSKIQNYNIWFDI